MLSHITQRFKKIKVGVGDLGIVLFSLVLALFLWFLQNLSEDFITLVDVAVTAESNIDGYSTESSNSAIVSARCKYSGISLFSIHQLLNRKPVRVFIEPKDLVHKEGDVFVLSNAALPKYANAFFGDNASLESFISQNIQFRFNQENHKRVPVMPVHQLSFKSQYMAASEMVVEPDSITIYGEPFRLDNIDRVYTENIVLKDLKTSRHGTVNIERNPEVRYSEKSVNYSLDVTRFVEIKETVRVSTRNFSSSKNISVYPSTAEVIYKCVFPLQKDPTSQVSIYIDGNDFNSSINGRCVARAANLPIGVISYTIEPQIFEVIESSHK